ncbi:WD40-repeat-containing domain protein [Limtongia smithiae]|uniref:WD40-repeat-containing domain protein n=1 Tax=Limtongia smithiae TaxID=1125753 RepID=UPI0034CE6BF5
MRPIILKGHERPLTQLKYNREGDLLFTTARDKIVNVYDSHNGERLGTYSGHQGAVFSVDVDPTSTVIATGSGDNTVRLWDVRTGKCVHVWKFNASAKFVQFNEDGNLLLVVTEQHMGQQGTIHVFDVVCDVEAKQSEEPAFKFVCGESKFTVAGWSYLSRYIITGHLDGSVAKYDAKSGELVKSVDVHEKEVTDLQFAPDLTYFITASKDKTAKILDTDNLNIMKTYASDSSLNTAAITPLKDYVILGGGQDAKDVTTTSARQGKFEARFYHKIFEDEIGRVRGHFGPLNNIVVHPAGTGFASGSEDGYVRVHHFDKSYFDFLYDAERMRME